MSWPISLGKLFIHDPLASRSHTDVFVGGSDPKRSRRLIILTDFPRISRFDQSYLAEAITKECQEGFDKTRELPADKSLEKILDQLNFLLPHITPKKNPHWLEQLNLLVGISDGTDIHFAHLGQMFAWLLHDNVFSLISPNTKVINPLKLFSSCTSGELDEGDTLIFTTSALTDYVSEVKIRQIISSGSAAEAVDKFEILLEQVPRFVSFVAVIIKGQEEENENVQQLPLRIRPEAAETDNLGTVNAPAVRRRPRRARRSDLAAQILAGIVWWLRFFVINAWAYFKLLGKFFAAVVRYAIKAFRFISNKTYRAEAEKRQWHRLENIIDHAHDSFQNKHWTHRWLILGCIILVLIILNSIIYSGQNLQISKRLTNYQDSLIQLSSLQSDVDAARIYKDDKKAESILTQMLNIIGQLTPQEPNQQKQLADLREKINRELTEVRHINYLEAPLLYRDLAELKQELKNITVINNVSYISAANGIYRLNNQAEQIINKPLTNGFLLSTSKNVLVLLDGRSLFTLSGSNLQPSAVTWNTNLQATDQALIYGDNLYVLDRTSAAIYKNNGDGSGQKFGNGSVWFQDSNLMPHVQSFTVDGNIWLINDQGEIIKLFKGQRQTFDYQRPLPAFGPGSIILTTQKSLYLYILDPANKRVAIMDKKGSIKDQFSSPKFDNLKSFAVDAAEKIIYLLNADKVYQLAITK